MWGAALHIRRSIALLAFVAAAVVASPLGDAFAADTTAPSTPTGLKIFTATTSSVAVTWERSTDDVAVAGYGVYKNGTFVGALGRPKYNFPDLNCGTTYTFAVDAYDASGNRSAKAFIRGTTNACSAPTPNASDSTPPSVPDNMTITGTTQTTIALSWSPSTDNTGVTGYRLYRNNVLAAAVAGTSYTYTGLTCGTTYTVGLTAIDAAGNESNVAFAQGPASTSACSSADTTAPSTPTALATSSISQTSITLSWSASTDNVGVTGYGRYRNGTLVSSAAGTSFTFAGLSCGTSYTLAVDAYDAAGNRSARASVSASTSACSAPADTTPPSVPDNMVITGATQTTISLSWSPSTDNVAVTGYRLYKNNVLTATVAATSYTYTGLNCGTTYTVGLTALDAAGNESDVIFAQGPASTSACSTADTIAPSAPTALATSSISPTSITLSWAASTDNIGVAGYGRYLNGTLLSSATGTSYTYTGLSCGTTYTLAVDAYDAAGNRSARTAVTAATSACTGGDTMPPSSPSGLATGATSQTSITLSWAASTDNVGVVGYGRYRDGALLSTGATTSYMFTGLDCGTTYALGVDAYDAAGNRSARATVNATTAACTDTTPPSTPTGLATSSIGQTSITLSWNASTDNVGVTGYGRYRNGTLLSSGTGTSFTFSGLTCGTSYALGVDAYDAAGNRSARASVNVTTTACVSSSGAAVFLSPSGSDSNACTQAAPCRTFSRGYAVAQLGQTVELAAGSYGSQTLSGSKTGSGVVTFRPAAGASVSTSDLSLNGQTHIEFQNMSFDNWYMKYSSDITFRNVATRFFFVRVSDNVRLLGGSVGPSQDSTSPTIGGYDAGSPSRDVLLDGVTFHDIGRQLAPGGHVECLFVQESSGVTIRNSKFRNCDVMDMYVNPIFGGQVANLTVENNWFDQPRPSGYYAFDMSIQPGLRVAYNSWAGVFRLLEGAWTGAQVIGNVGHLNNCSVTGVTWSHNVWDNQKCAGSSDIVAPNGFVDETNFNLHLAPGAAAINRGDPSSYPTTDIDGQTRPLGGAPDAGADEAA